MTATGDASPSVTPARSARDGRDMSHDTIRAPAAAASARAPKPRRLRDEVHDDAAQGAVSFVRRYVCARCVANEAIKGETRGVTGPPQRPERGAISGPPMFKPARELRRT